MNSDHPALWLANPRALPHALIPSDARVAVSPRAERSPSGSSLLLQQPNHSLTVVVLVGPLLLPRWQNVQVEDLEHERRGAQEGGEALQGGLATGRGGRANDFPPDLNVDVHEQVPARGVEPLLDHHIV